ncbi:MAG: hypothetical protein SOH60_05465 [Lachnospiraceae bacterium]
MRARLININSGHNKEMLEKCSALGDYSLLVSLILEYLDNCLPFPIRTRRWPWH